MRTRSGLVDDWAAAAKFQSYCSGTWDAPRDTFSWLREGGLFLVLEADQLPQDALSGDGEFLVDLLRQVRRDLAPQAFSGGPTG
jgi:hypothetical protein